MRPSRRKRLPATEDHDKSMRTLSSNTDRRPSRGWIFLLPFLFFALMPPAVSGDPPGAPEGGTIGSAVTANVPHVRESLSEIRALAPNRLPKGAPERAIPFRRTPVPIPSTAGEPTDAAALVPAGSASVPIPVPRSSVLAADFKGLDNPPPGMGDAIPPDTMGAAGPAHLVSLLNTDWGVFDKAGKRLASVSLESFWASLGAAADFPFDPKILYDQHSGRFVAMSLDCTVATHSWILIAVSSTSDPLGPWDKWAIDADRDNGIQTNNIADYPGLGVDQFNIYVTSNMFNAADEAQYSKAWVIPKAQLLTDPGPIITWYEFLNPEFSMQPAHTFGEAAAEYFLFEGTSTQLHLARIDNAAGTPVWHPPAPVAVARYTPMFSTPGAPQLGDTRTIDTSDTRMLNVVYRNGSVWAAHHVVGTSGKVEAAWYRIDPVFSTIVSQGRVNDPNRWYYYPSIAVNQDNVAAIGFTGSSPTEYAGGYYTIVWPSTGTADPVSLLKSGEAPYFKTLSGTSNRWGDFSATMVDPTDGTSFWTLQEYAQLPDTRSRWGTWWGKIVPGQPSPPPPARSSGGGGGCLSVARPGGPPDVTSLVSFVILLLPACTLVLRRFCTRRSRPAPFRHPVC